MANDDFYGDEEKPSKDEYLATGLFGVALFSTLLCFAIYCWKIAKKDASKVFYTGMFFMSALELPRYVLFIATREYTSKTAYSLHILAGICFFYCLTCVCFIWAKLLELGPVSKFFYSKRGLVGANILLGCLQIAAFGACLSEPDLESFINSTLFLVFIIEEITQSLVYSTFLCIFGIRLIFRIRNYATYGKMKVFEPLVRKLSITLSITSLDSLLRLGVLILQICSMQSNIHITRLDALQQSFTRYGFFWFLLAEFLPRGLSALVLMLLMNNRNTAQKDAQIAALAQSENSSNGLISSSLAESLVSTTSDFYGNYNTTHTVSTSRDDFAGSFEM